MPRSQAPRGDNAEPPADATQVRAPTISLPKGGGAIRGIGEKFAANPVTGTGSMSVPIATSPGRSGFGPQISLSYDSGAGNGPFGFGWNLSLPSITRKTDKGLPQYNDAEDSDVFILSGAEDLVPVLEKKDGKWVLEKVPDRKIGADTYSVRRYRPRIEGLFARIERWTNTATGEIHWRSISKDNIATLYGKDNNSRIFDPAEIPDSGKIEDAKPTRIFAWLICETRDDKGNAVLYEYKPEDSFEIDLTQPHERNRGGRNDPRRRANRYLKRIRYGNQITLLDTTGNRPVLLSADQIKKASWMFEVVLDYGEHDAGAPKPADPGEWTCRNDPFSSYRAGFEIRTYRLCQRVLMFHHFPNEPDVGADCLVRSTDFNYSYEQNTNDARNPIYSFLLSVTQSGHKRQGNGYLKRSLPPVEFEYTQPIVKDDVEDVDPASLENLPVGLDGNSYQWTDLHGEGIPGILTEQAGAWFYKRNLSPIPERQADGREEVRAQFASVETVASKPNLALSSGAQFLDLAGDGQPDLVVMDGPMPGFYEHDEAESWGPFRPFRSRLNRDMRDPNLKFVDLDGDGHADVLITEDNAFVWHASQVEDGFGTARRVAQELDDEKGPRLVFADGTQSIYLADLSGDGLTDLARIRNGEVCYWPNLGYGRFEAKVTMDNAPWFDNPDQFDHKRVRLADIDGSGTTDIIYLHRDGVRLYFNQSGNGWGAAQQLNVFPRVDDLMSIMPIDLLGNGTACLVWSSPLPGDARRPMRYVNLMGGQRPHLPRGQKPHLLVKTINNLGDETMVEYAPSTKFYLQDKRDGKPWITRLPFPVHVVEKVTVTDKWRKTRFSSTYSFHHGYFDGAEREFRGFGRVEQLDCESYGTFASGNSASPYITDDKTLYQPPVKTVTWYHTGAALDRERILSQFEHEYFPHWFEDLRPDEVNLLGDFQENVLPEPDLEAENLSAADWREAMRACKGMMLRQEVCELDVDALERGEQRPVKLFSTAYHNCHIRQMQPKALNPHAVFLVAESEAITYHYELDLRQDTLRPDPRIAHTLTLKFDEHANVLQSVAVVYGRLGKFLDSTLPADALALIGGVQQERHLAYTETRYTDDYDLEDKDSHRLRMPCEVLTYELTGISPEDADDRLTLDLRDNFYFTLDELRRFRLSQAHQSADPRLTEVQELSYHQLPKQTIPEKRLVEHARTLFFDENLVDPLPFREHGRLGLTYEAYKLALTETLLNAVFKDAAGNKLDQPIDGVATARARLDDPTTSGYLSGPQLASSFASVPAAELAGQYWIRSGIAGYAPDATQHFYLPERYTDSFGNVTTLTYAHDLLLLSSMDALANTTRVTQFDYRTLAPREMQDINDNLTEVFFDVLGLPVAMALKGKGNEGDNLTGLTDAIANPESAELVTFFDQPDLDVVRARAWLGNATARHIYYFGEIRNPDGSINWVTSPACACGILREQHVSQLELNDQSPLQTAFEYSDGMGSVLEKIVQAEPEATGQPLRWVVSGKTVLNNKGKPVKQYEPYFSPPDVGHMFSPIEAERGNGVTSVLYYDAVGRVMRTELPDGGYSKVEFTPWHVRTFDPNDTAFDPHSAERSDWYERRKNPAHPRFAEFNSSENVRAAESVEAHGNTPALTILDSLGRDVISIAHNRVKDAAGALKDEKYLTFSKLDAEGKPLWIRDARANLVMQYITPVKPTRAVDESDSSKIEDIPDNSVPCYDIAGNLLYQHSMDAGDRWMLNDAAGKPMLAWDNRDHVFRTDYDQLHRPLGSFVQGADLQDRNRMILFEKTVYGDAPGNGLSATAPNDQTRKLNLRGRPYKHHDTAGLVVSLGRNPATGADEAFDFKGNPLRSTRQLAKDYKHTPDWSQNAELVTEVFTSSTRYDALNRPIQLVAPHSDQPGAKFNVVRHGYNEASLLERVDVWLEQSAEPAALLAPTTANLKAVTNIDYDAKGQRIHIEYNEANHPIITNYTYDRETFRLIHLVSVRPMHADADKRTLQNLSYAYDTVGNITEIQDRAQQAVFFNNSLIEPSNTYVYDALYRLLRAEGREHAAQNNVQRDAKDFEPIIGIPFPNSPEALQRYSEDYEYDPVGNILAMHHIGGLVERWVRRYQYGVDSNRLLATRLPGDPGKLPDYAGVAGYGAKYTYDVHGNMTRMPHLPVMAWDFKNQLQATQRQVVNSNPPPEKVAETTFYVHDSGGQRVRKVTEDRNGKPKSERIYLGGFEVYRSYNGNGRAIALERETLHVMDDKQRIALVETRTLDTAGTDRAPKQLIRYQLANHLCSASLELDEQAQIISYEEYAPYGNSTYQAVRSHTETPKRYRFTGNERDEENGLSYHGTRYYAVWLGRWVSCDPAGLVEGTNLYWYSQDNAVMRIDRTGKESKIFEPHASGDIGELNLSQAFDKTGRFEPLAFDPSRSGSQSGGGNFDMVVFDRDTKRVLIVDNKAYSETIDKVSAFAKENFKKNLGTLKEQLRISGNAFDLAALDSIEKGNYGKVVANAYSKGNVGFSEKLFKEGIEALDVRSGKLYTDFSSYTKDALSFRKEAKAAGEVLSNKRVLATEIATPSSAPKPPETKVAQRVGVIGDVAESAGRRASRRVLMAIPVVDLIYQQIDYKNTAYTGDRPLDAVLNITIAELWEVPLGIKGLGELVWEGIKQQGKQMSEDTWYPTRD